MYSDLIKFYFNVKSIIVKFLRFQILYSESTNRWDPGIMYAEECFRKLGRFQKHVLMRILTRPKKKIWTRPKTKMMQ